MQRQGVEPLEADLRTVLAVLAQDGRPAYRVDDLAVGLRMPWAAVRRALAVLVEAGAVTCEGGWYQWTGATRVTVRVPPTVTCSSPGRQSRQKRERQRQQPRGVWVNPDEYMSRRKRLVAAGR